MRFHVDDVSIDAVAKQNESPTRRATYRSTCRAEPFEFRFHSLPPHVLLRSTCCIMNRVGSDSEQTKRDEELVMKQKYSKIEVHSAKLCGAGLHLTNSDQPLPKIEDHQLRRYIQTPDIHTLPPELLPLLFSSVASSFMHASHFQDLNSQGLLGISR